MAACGCKTVVSKQIAFVFPAPWEERWDGIITPFSRVAAEVHRDHRRPLNGKGAS